MTHLDAVAGPGTDASSGSPRRVIGVALGLGLFTGLVDTAIGTIGHHWLGSYRTISSQSAWLAPLADTLIFGVAAVGLLAFGTVVRLARRPAVYWGAFGFLMFASFTMLVGGLHGIAKLLIAAGLAIQAVRLVGPRLPVLERRLGRATPWMLAIVALIAIVDVGGRAVVNRRAFEALPDRDRATRPNILLLILDTVRARSLSLYGYSRPTTPELEKLAADAIVFDWAIAPAPWTMPSHASMFTGQPPHELSADWETPLDGTFPTVAEALAAGGYLTAGFMANAYYAGRAAGFDRGFVHFEDHVVSVGDLMNSSSLGDLILAGRVHSMNALRRLVGNTQMLGRRNAAEIRESFVRWADDLPNDRPFFAALNFFDAHAPYYPPEPFASRFTASGPHRNSTLESRYDGTVAYLDHQIGLLRADLARLGLARNTVIVVTADHGELFGEHDLNGHGNALFIDQLRVPLLVVLPDGTGRGRRIIQPVSLSEFAATALELARVRPAAPTFGRHSWVRYWDGSPVPADSEIVVMSEVREGIRSPRQEPVTRGDMLSLVGSGWHYIRNGDGVEELYDLGADPDELTNLAHRPEARARLHRFRRAAPAQQWEPRP